MTKPNWVNRPYSFKICQIDFPIVADCLEGVLATATWRIMPTDVVAVRKVIYARYKTPHQRNAKLMEDLHRKNVNYAYLELMDRLAEAKEEIRKLGWKVMAKGVVLPRKGDIITALGIENPEFYKYTTKTHSTKL